MYRNFSVIKFQRNNNNTGNNKNEVKKKRKKNYNDISLKLLHWRDDRASSSSNTIDKEEEQIGLLHAVLK